MTIEVRQRVGQKEEKPEVEQNATEQKPALWDPMQEGVKWIEKYAEPMEKFFQRLPEFIGTFCATFAVFTFGATLRGETFSYFEIKYVTHLLIIPQTSIIIINTSLYVHIAVGCKGPSEERSCAIVPKRV